LDGDALQLEPAERANEKPNGVGFSFAEHSALGRYHRIVDPSMEVVSAAAASFGMDEVARPCADSCGHARSGPYLGGKVTRNQSVDDIADDGQNPPQVRGMLNQGEAGSFTRERQAHRFAAGNEEIAS
jgi:hypothetical protein